MPYTKVIEQLTDNLQLAYRQAIDADNALDELKKAGHGKFSYVFTAEEGFSTRSNRFQPYIQELAEELNSLKQAPSAAKLETMVRKLGLLLQTLQALKSHNR